MYCHFCGRQVDDDLEYCTNCGKQQYDQNSNIQGAEEIPIAQTYDGTFTTKENPSDNITKNTQRVKKGLSMTGIIIIAALVVIGGFFLYTQYFKTDARLVNVGEKYLFGKNYVDALKLFNKALDINQ